MLWWIWVSIIFLALSAFWGTLGRSGKFLGFMDKKKAKGLWWGAIGCLVGWGVFTLVAIWVALKKGDLPSTIHTQRNPLLWTILGGNILGFILTEIPTQLGKKGSDKLSGKKRLRFFWIGALVLGVSLGFLVWFFYPGVYWE